MKTNQLSSQELQVHLSRHRVVPVLAGDFSAEKCVALARALLAGGINVMERPLRGEAVEEILDGIKEVRRYVPEMIIGAGTITSTELLHEAFHSGARFGVSPGAVTQKLHEEIQSMDFPFIPGVLPQNTLDGDQVANLETATRLFEMGYKTLKWFHAGKSGGPNFLRTFVETVPNAHWVPMGSIEEAGVQNYVDIPQVLCCGGSWVAPLKLIEGSDWQAITELAKRAVR